MRSINTFNSGLGLSLASVGLATPIFGVLGISIQILRPRPLDQWIAIILLFQVAVRTFSRPSSGILLTNSAPSPLVLGRIHGLAISLVSLSKLVGLIVTGVFGIWLRQGLWEPHGDHWWRVSVVGAVVALWLREDQGVCDVERGGE